MKSLFKSTLIVMIMAVISRFIGFFRDILIANNFGASNYTDAYKTATAIPETIFTIVGLAISTSFLPMLSKVKVKKGTDEMHKFANNIINILFIISLIIFIVASFFPEEIVKLLANGLDEETLKLASELARISLLNIIFLSINACFTALLQVHEDFVIPSILGLFFNLPIIIYLLLFKSYNVHGLMIANVIGNFLRVAVQVPSLRKHGYRYKPFINIKDEKVKAILILIVPVIIGAGANSLNMIVDKRIASSLGEGAITTLDNAQLLITFINTIITTSISTVVYPILANRRNEGKYKEFLDILSKSIVFLAILLIPISMGVILFKEEIITIVYKRGMYSDSAVSLTVMALTGYAIGIFFTGVRDILNSILFSMGKTKITAKNGVIGVIINIALSLTLSKKFGILGITISSSIAMMVTSILLLINITKLVGEFKVKPLMLKLTKIVISSAIMSLVIILAKGFIASMPIILFVIVGTIIGIITYFIMTLILKIEEVKEIVNLLKNKEIK